MPHTPRRPLSLLLLALTLVGVGLLTAIPLRHYSLHGLPASPREVTADESKDTGLSLDVAGAAGVHDPTRRPAVTDERVQARVAEQYGRLPLSFEVNRGQVDDDVKYLSRGDGYNLFLTPTEAVLALGRQGAGRTNREQVGEHGTAGPGDVGARRAVLRMKLVGANPSAEIRGEDEQPGKSNYFIGNNPSGWRTNVPHYARVRYGQVYPGVDIVYYGDQRRLEYDLIVTPGASLSPIKMDFEGAQGISLDDEGALRLSTPGGELRQHRPLIYQDVDGRRQEVAGRYVIKGGREVGFEVADYDVSRPLVIDPVLSYSTYLGGSRDDVGLGIAVDSSGNAYVTGYTSSENFPAVNSMSPGNDFNDVFVTKLNAAGSALVYSTYLGGGNHEQGNAVAVDRGGNAYVTGYTQSVNFPTASPLQASHRGESGSLDAFVAKLNPNGSALVYSTYLGGVGAEFGRGIALDSAGDAYVTGQTDSADFPTANALQPVFGGYHFGGDAYVSKLNPAGTAFVYSTYLGGNSYDEGNAIAVDSAGNAYVTGTTHSTNFPTANPFQAQIVGGGCSGGNGAIAQCFDAFVSKLNASGSALLYSTFLGGDGGDGGSAIAVDSTGSAYVSGSTNAENFPVANAFQPHLTGSGSFIAASDAFVTKFNPAGTALIYSTYLGGGGGGETGRSIAVDSAGNAYLTGSTYSSGFPTVDSLKTADGSQDAFLTKMNAAGSALLYSTLLGGSNNENGYALAVDSAGNAYVTGAAAGGFPTLNAIQPNYGGGNINLAEGDAFIAKIGNNSIPQPVVLSISAVTPNRGGNAGSVSVAIHGSGFKSGATVKLIRAGRPDIIATVGGVNTDGTVARALIDLTGQAPGVRNVVVTNPDGSSISRENAFTVEAGGEPKIWVDIMGSDAFRPGRPQTYYIAFGNRGNIDATMVPIFISMPKEASYELGFNFLHLPQPAQGGTFDYSQVPAHYETSTEKVIPLLIAFLPAGSSDFLKIRVTGGNQPLRLLVRPARPTPFVYSVSRGAKVSRRPAPCVSAGGTNESESDFSIGDCLETVVTRVGVCAVGFIPAEKCVEASLMFLGSIEATTVQVGVDAANGTFTPSIGVISMSQVVAGGAVAQYVCAFDESPPGALIIGAIGCGLEFSDISSSCLGFDVFGEAAKLLIPLISRDPNAKFGPTGTGASHYVTGEEPLHYSIAFENLASANAPVQDVVITDQLDASRLDFDTFSLGPVGFGKDKQFVPPSGLTEFTRDVDLRPANNLIVRVNAKLDKTTGLLTWRFTSLDPVSMQPTEDPRAGFLPPNVAGNEGEGQVLFTVRPKEGLATGTAVRNKATIVFDTNAPLDTPEWLNTLDNSKPVSHVLPLAAAQDSVIFNVNWAGADTGSGVRSYTVFVSESGGAFTAWLSKTTAVSGAFVGRPGTTYSFYSVAQDQTGNQEGGKASAEATTTTTSSISNSIDDPRFFVRQHYLDFLNREPDASGLQFWTNEITQCGSDAQCREVKRINVSAAFFLSIEFQDTGYLAYRAHKAAFGDLPGKPVPVTRAEMLPEMQQIGSGVVVGVGDWQGRLEQNKRAYFDGLVAGARFASLYPQSQTPEEFVDALNRNAGGALSQAERDALVNDLKGHAKTRAQVLRAMAEDADLKRAEFHKAFVLMQYFGYLRRNPDNPPDHDFGGWQFWLGKLNAFNGDYIQAEMVKAFLNADEYRNRFMR